MRFPWQRRSQQEKREPIPAPDVTPVEPEALHQSERQALTDSEASMLEQTQETPAPPAKRRPTPARPASDLARDLPAPPEIAFSARGQLKWTPELRQWALDLHADGVSPSRLAAAMTRASGREVTGKLIGSALYALKRRPEADTPTPTAPRSVWAAPGLLEWFEARFPQVANQVLIAEAQEQFGVALTASAVACKAHTLGLKKQRGGGETGTSLPTPSAPTLQPAVHPGGNGETQRKAAPAYAETPPKPAIAPELRGEWRPGDDSHCRAQVGRLLDTLTDQTGKPRRFVAGRLILALVEEVLG